jgi:3-carboxy-cis,cis-muconate cycloisomerase
VHAGATSQDIMDTATMTVVGRVRDLIVADLDGVVAGAMDLARRHRTTPMAARTLGMQAVPTTFGLVAAGWMVTCDEAREGLRRLEPPAQLGGAAGTLAATGPVGLLAAFAAETGLAEPVLPWHTDRAPIIAAASALAGVTAALGKAATDVVRLSATEVAEVAEPARAGRGGSSAMPHKRNPVLATMIRSAALQVPGLAQILMSAALAPLQRPAGEWHAEWEPLRSCLRLAGGGAATGAELLHGLEVFPARMCANMRPELMSEHVALALAPAIGRDAARRVAARAAAAGRPLADALPAALTDEGLPDELPGDLLSELLDPAAATGRAPELVDRAIAAVAARS